MNLRDDPRITQNGCGWYKWSASYMGELYAEGGCRTQEEARLAATDAAHMAAQVINGAERTITWEIER